MFAYLVKRKISVTIEENNLVKVREILRRYRYGNKSRVIEGCVRELLREMKDED